MTHIAMSEDTDAVNISQYLQDLISSNSELGSRLLSLLLVSSGNGKEIMDAINKGDLGSIRNLDLAVDLKMPNGSENKDTKSNYARQQLALLSNGGRPQQHQQPQQENIASSLSDAVSNPTGDRRKKNTEASARFRIRKKQKEQEKLNRLKELNIKITGLYKRIDVLLEENQHWKEKLEELNERKSREMLDRIRKRNAKSPLS
ncbi:hypothetical protein ZYGR_0AV01650 [Zygosaccharomyces rouxii]|uniref:BZIP domain-containing protein n=1 Tax=Zygosaccharomyces rouxii TaxID=4956 RepID=A0A1Q3AJ40_ZYGRO|nr:hypothetical protein ZYGR_0AV01650 [Zygosaccharomyces rouxii]